MSSTKKSCAIIGIELESWGGWVVKLGAPVTVCVKRRIAKSEGKLVQLMWLIAIEPKELIGGELTRARQGALHSLRTYAEALHMGKTPFIRL